MWNEKETLNSGCFFYDIVGIQSRKFVFISKKHDWRIKVMQYMIILIWCGCDNIECYQISVLLVNSEREKGHWQLRGLPSSPIIVFSVDDSWLLKLPNFFSFSGCFICLNKLLHCTSVSWLNMGWQQIMELYQMKQTIEANN